MSGAAAFKNATFSLLDLSQSGFSSRHCRIIERSGRFETSFLSPSVALVTGSVSCDASHLDGHRQCRHLGTPHHISLVILLP
jgi:hypothetical protein